MILKSIVNNTYLKLRNTETNVIIFNHILVLFFFFITSSASVVKTIIFILIALFILRGNYLFYITNALKNKVIMAFFMYFLIHLITIPFSNDIISSILYTKNMKILLFPIILFSYIKSEFIPRFYISFIFGMLVSEFISYGMIFELWKSPFYNAATHLNPTPFFNHVFYGIFLSFTVALLLIEIFNTKNYKNKILHVIFLITISLNIFFNASRSGFYLYIISVLLTVFLLNKNRFKTNLKYIIIIIGSIVLFASYLSPTFQNRMNEAKNDITSIYLHNNFHSSFGIRLKQQIDTISILKEDPILLIHGAGAGQTMYKLKEYSKSHLSDNTYNIYNHLPDIHNQYAVSLLQFGLIGLLLIINIFYQILRYKQSNPVLKIPQTVLTVLFIFFSMHEASLVLTICSIFFIFTITVTLKPHVNFTIQNVTIKGILYYIFAGALLLLIALNS